MSAIRFIHTADLHLDSPFGKLSRLDESLASRLRDAGFRTFSRIVDTALSEQVDFVLIAGDIFDGEQRSLAAQLGFIKQLKRLSAAAIPVYFNCGNHDPLSSWMKHLTWPPGVHRFGSEKVETLVFEKNGEPLAAIAGISFGDKVVTENLALRFPPAREEIPFSIALLHGSYGHSAEHAPYAPFQLRDVQDKGYDYWALGHIHKPSLPHENNPVIAYPGIPQGRDFGESGPRGFYMVELKKGEEAHIEFREAAEVLFLEKEVELSEPGRETEQIAEALTEALPGTPGGAIFRLTLTGRTPMHRAFAADPAGLLEHINSEWEDAATLMRVDRIDVRTQPEIDLDELRGRDDFAASLLSAFDETEKDNDRRKELLEALEEGFYKHKLLRRVEALSDEEMKNIVERARWLLLDKLLKGEE